MTAAQRHHIAQLLERGETVPYDYKNLLFPPERREYELVYRDKEREEDVIADTMAVPLQSIREFGNVESGSWHNYLIFGDNLQAMKSMLRLKEQRKLVNADGSQGVKLVYIDPPFATKSDFQSGNDERAYRDKVVGAEFIEFVRKRLILLRELLSTNGSIFVHIDQRKGHYLKVVLDEVFGEANFRSEIILPGRASKNLQQQFETIARLNVRHDVLLWYSRSSSTRFAPMWVEKHKQGNPEGHWHHFWSTANRPTMRYTLFGITPDSGQWTWSEIRALNAVENYERFEEEGGGRTLAEYWRDTGSTLDFIRTDPHDGKPMYWRAPADLRLADTVWSGVTIYSNSTRYPTEKHEALLAQVINMSSDTGDIVLDAFSGSGTTVAVAEKLGRRWIGIDSGKLSIYTIQKRLLSLRSGIGKQNGKSIEPRPFALYNAGLYDFSRLKSLPWNDWRLFALNLFECQDEPHTVRGIPLDGYRLGSDVLVFNHRAGNGVVLDYGFIEDLGSQLGNSAGDRFFIIAPAASVLFIEDYVDVDNIRFYVLRIPYSIINELHQRNFEAINQPIDEEEVNNTVEAVGFDFIRQPKVVCEYVTRRPEGQLIDTIVVKIKTFESKSMARGAASKANRESLSMVLIDFDYPLEAKRESKDSASPFAFDQVFYAHTIESSNWEIRLPVESMGEHAMLVYIDIYGNEYTEVVSASDFTPEVIEVSIVTEPQNA